MGNESHKLVTILNARFIHEVQIAKSKLEIEGIQSFIVDENIASSLGGTAFVDGYKLEIDIADVEKAKTILDSISE